MKRKKEAVVKNFSKLTLGIDGVTRGKYLHQQISLHVPWLDVAYLKDADEKWEKA